jgi:hypothetical protein
MVLALDDNQTEAKPFQVLQEVFGPRSLDSDPEFWREYIRY